MEADILQYYDDDFKKIGRCPMCEGAETIELYEIATGANDDFEGKEINRSVKVVKCNKCGFVYAKEILNTKGRAKFWRNYASRCHESNNESVQKRKLMYELEYKYVMQFIQTKNPTVLDVGCGEGGFLDFFKGSRCYGIEVGEEAAEKASLKHTIYRGELPDIDFPEGVGAQFDLIIFRGVLQYCDEPVRYLLKADNLLKQNGLIFITSTPNMDSFCAKLFKEYFSFAVCPVAGNGFSPKMLTHFFNRYNYALCGEKFFYEETPYCNLMEDIKKVSRAIELMERGEKVNFRSPAFWGNMMSLVYKKMDG